MGGDKLQGRSFIEMTRLYLNPTLPTFSLTGEKKKRKENKLSFPNELSVPGRSSIMTYSWSSWQIKKTADKSGAGSI